MNIETKDVIKYMTLPRIIPRIKTIFSPFKFLALFMAYVFNSVGLISNSHPYLNPKNIGRYGVSHVMAQAANNIVFDKKHLDQIAIFIIILLASTLLLVQVFMLLISLLSTEAIAGAGMTAAHIGRFFAPHAFYDPNFDIANIFLEAVFGMPGGAAIPGFPGAVGFFDTCASQIIECFPDPSDDPFTKAPYFFNTGFPSGYHLAMEAMFEYYNLGILVFGLAVFLYFVVVVVAETAKDGTPFGRRFNGFWAPVRLMFAMALMMPVDPNLGYSFSQIMTLRIAYAGSNLASNGWVEFHNTLLAGGPLNLILGNLPDLTAQPNHPDMNQLVDFIQAARACYWAELKLNNRQIGAYLVEQNKAPLELYPNSWDPNVGGGLRNWTYAAPADLAGGIGMGISFLDALDYTNYDGVAGQPGGNEIVIRFGEIDPGAAPAASAAGAAPIPGLSVYEDEKGYVYPWCGELTMQIEDGYLDAVLFLHRDYLALVKILWADEDIAMVSENITQRLLPISDREPTVMTIDGNYYNQTMTWIDDLVRTAGLLNLAIMAADPQNNWTIPVVQYGWAGAGIFYNKLQDINGSFYRAARNVPWPTNYPYIMEHVADRRENANEFVTHTTRFNPFLSDGRVVDFDDPNHMYAAMAMYEAQSLWFQAYEETRSNSVIDSILWILGVDSMQSILNNVNMHPLAQLVAIGQSLTEAASRNLVGAAAAGAIGKFTDRTSTIGEAASTLAGFMTTFGLIALSLGFILNYVLPFLPFIYFYFAVGGWVKAIFEAFVAMPLFAIAHVRIDGNGLPGPVAMSGYWLLLEIAIRPILILFGLLASVHIFSAQVTILNDIWYLVLTNLTGFDHELGFASGGAAYSSADFATHTGSFTFMRGELDQFFYTVIYAIFVYLIGMSSFKLIDNIPNYVLRWMNAGVSTFGEKTQNPGETLIMQVFQGSQMFTNASSSAFAGIFGRSS
jgi:hypothetical protein